MDDSIKFIHPIPVQKSNSSWNSIKKKQKWKQQQAHIIPCLLLLLFFRFGLVSGKQQAGQIVTQSDHQALKAIKQEFVDSRGVLNSWNDTGAGACSGWAGIKCVNGQVIAIHLPWKGLGGRISEKIGQLRELRRLSLHDNVLVGRIPTSLGFLPNLRGVYLFNNRISGNIPPSIGNCLLLQTLDVSNNQLTGTIPPSLANSTRLYRLNLSFNGISRSIPVSISKSLSLTFLALQHNNISGSIPDTWGGKESGNYSYQLQSLALDHNLLSGKIPASLSKLTMLEELNLSDNQIVWNIPDELGSLSRLNSLDLSNNAMSGNFPDTLSRLSSLVTLNLKNNNLDGQIPTSIDRLGNLSVLNLSNNKFNGRIPDTIGNITSITSLDLSGNNLTGDIPISLVNLQNLSSFDVSYNNLSGTVPSVLAKKFNSTSFLGNIQLCGYSISTPCPSPPPENLPSPSQGSLNHHNHRRKLSTKDIILIAAGALLIVLLILCCVLVCCLIRKKAASKTKNGSKIRGIIGRGATPVPAVGTEVESGGETGGKLVHFDGTFVFTADDLLCATAEIMGKSTYGTAYKATLEDNNEVAVKRLGPKGEKLLVYDHMPNGSLASFLHARGPETSVPWATRRAIAIGIARGICYLHTEQNIVHGNLTSSNILLDEQKEPKIADVGISRLMTSGANTDAIATAGTMGYRAPELLKLKNATNKTDVFSVGVIILELLTGKSPSEATDGLDLPQWVASIVKEEWTNEVFDVELMRENNADGTNNIGEELLSTLKLALHCVDPTPAARPEALQVVEKLEEIKTDAAANVSSSVDG